MSRKQNQSANISNKQQDSHNCDQVGDLVVTKMETIRCATGSDV